MAIAMTLRLHHFLPRSRANGPGVRAVTWVQGCSLGCPGCFNPETHAPSGGDVVNLDELCQRILALGDSIEGLTISGGEPLQQCSAVTELLRRIKAEARLSVILFTGFEWEEVMRMAKSEGRRVGGSARESIQASARLDAVRHANHITHGKRSHAPTLSGSHALSFADTPTPRHPDTPAWPEFLNYVDVLIAGRYDQGQRLARGLRGSTNKTVHLLTDRYTAGDLESVPIAEVMVTPHGELLLSGIEPVSW